jgi:ABC-type sugar transport system ATPase subunit
MTPLLQVQSISKSFGPNRVLHEVTLGVEASSVHAIVGENGAGKSTLMNIIGGVHAPDSGTLRIDGEAVRLANPLDAIQRGISTVHQELSLFPNRTVAQNIMAGHEPVTAGGFVRGRAIEQQARAALERVGSPVDPLTPIGLLSVGAQQVVEIARALSRRARVLILDEPTSALSDHDARALLRVLAELREQGVAIIYISHKLPEVLAMANRISVLRDGRLVGSLDRREASERELVRLMVGREPDAAITRGASAGTDTILEVHGLTRPPAFHDVSFTLRRGEILGFAGLVGAGRTEVARAIFGADPVSGGTIVLEGAPYAPRSPRDAIDRGLAYLTEDRARLGLFLDLAVRDNITVASQRNLVSRHGWLRPGAMRRMAAECIERLGINPPDDGRIVRNLSGGNQQKALLGRWLATSPRVLIADEPTRGVDIGAKYRIHRHLQELAAAGAGIVLVSSDLLEVIGLSDRVAVFRAGRLVTVLQGGEATEETVMHHAAA